VVSLIAACFWEVSPAEYQHAQEAVQDGWYRAIEGKLCTGKEAQKAKWEDERHQCMSKL
jgi:hypothetical protein